MYYYWSEQKKPSSFILPQIPSVLGAYSNRKISAAISNPIRACRSSDNAENDIAFYQGDNISLSSAASGGGTYGSFVGANSATIAKWYDQSGNAKDAGTATLSLRPSSVSSGSLQTKNSKPTLVWSPDDQIVTSGGFANWNTTMTAFVVMYKTTGAQSDILDTQDPSAGYNGMYFNVYDNQFIFSINSGGSTQHFTISHSIPANTLFAMVVRVTRNGTMNIKVNSNSPNSASYTGATLSSLSAYAGNLLFGYILGGGVNNLRGGMSEVIISNEIVSDSVRDLWLANAMTYYGIT